MTKHDEGRRAFLLGTAMGAGAAASGALMPEAFAKEQTHHHAATTNAPAMQPMPQPVMAGMGSRHGAFFNDDDARTISAFVWPTAQAFFSALHKHTMEGMFSDPIYGGNKDFAGWRLVGFPGAQPEFTPEDMRSKEAFTREPIVGLQSRAKKNARG